MQDWKSEFPVEVPPPSLNLFTDLSHFGRRVHLQVLTTKKMLTSQEKELHINILEMKPVQLTLDAFLHLIMREILALMSVSATVVAYLESVGEGVSCAG